MAVTKSALKDNLIFGLLVAMLAILSFTTTLNVKTSQSNAEQLNLIRRCVLPAGDLCRDSGTGERLIEEIIRRVNEHTTEEVSRLGN